MIRAALLAALMGFAMTSAHAADTAPTDKGRITGIGGIFIKSKDPKALTAWYRDVLGIAMTSWGGAAIPLDQPGHPPVIVWNAFPPNADHFAPSTREFMLDFAVDDMDAFLAKLKAKGVTILDRQDSPEGNFAWLTDPDGTKIELWQPK